MDRPQSAANCKVFAARQHCWKAAVAPGANAVDHHFNVWVPWVMAAPARRAAVDKVVSASSASVAPAFLARPGVDFNAVRALGGERDGDGHQLFVFDGDCASLSAASSNAMKALNASGASSPRVLSFVRFFMSYMVWSLSSGGFE